MTVTVPVDALLTPKQPRITLPLAPDPPTQFPVTINVPVDELTTPPYAKVIPPVTFPTMDAEAGETAVNCRQLREPVMVLFVTLAVSVTPSFNV